MRCGGKLIISLLAGVSYDQLANVLQTDGKAGLIHPVLRVISSIGAKINESVTLIAETACAGHEQQMVTAWMFGCLSFNCSNKDKKGKFLSN